MDKNGLDGSGANVVAKFTIAEVIAPPLMMLTPFVGHVRYHGYSLEQPEILVSLSFLFGLGIVLSGLMALLSERSRALSAAIILLLVIDLQFPEFPWTRRVLEWGGPKAAFVLFLTIVAIVVSAAWLLRRHLYVILAVSLSVVLGSTLLFPVQTISIGETYKQSTGEKRDLPLVLHVILDEQIGIEGLPPEIFGATELGESLKGFYKNHGFGLFGAVFSRSSNTEVALSHLLSGSEDPVDPVLVDKKKRLFRVEENVWFKKLSEAGYAIRVYQSDYLDFCNKKDANIEYCFTYPSNSIRALENSEVGLHDKVWLMSSNYLRRSWLYRVGVAIGRTRINSPKLFTLQESWLGGLSALPMFDRIAYDMGASPKGTAFFAHLLLPHSSYIFDSECLVRSDPATWFRSYDPASHKLFSNTPVSRQERYSVYFDQVRCTHQMLARLFSKMQSLGIYEDATVIVHGDHGSRIAINSPSVGNKELLSSTDFKDNYSTLLAIKSPAVTKGYYREKRSLQGAFADIVLNQPFPNENANVFLRPGDSFDGLSNGPENLQSVPMRW